MARRKGTPNGSLVCGWYETEDGQWETGCGYTFEFNDGGPTANKFRFCGYCGRGLREYAYDEPRLRNAR